MTDLYEAAIRATLPGYYRDSFDQEGASIIVQRLLAESVFFVVLPLAYDLYEITVKAEDLPRLAALSERLEAEQTHDETIEEHVGLIENEVNWDMIERVPSEEDDAYPEDDTPDPQQLEQDIRDIAETLGIDLGPFHIDGSAIILDTPQTDEEDV